MFRADSCCEPFRGPTGMLCCGRDTGARMTETERLRILPKVDHVLHHAALAEPLARLGQPVVVRAVQLEVDALRLSLRDGGKAPADRDAALETVATRSAVRLAALLQPSLRRVINATGVVLHTNLGRARHAPRRLRCSCGDPLREPRIRSRNWPARQPVEHLGELVAALLGARRASSSTTPRRRAVGGRGPRPRRRRRVARRSWSRSAMASDCPRFSPAPGCRSTRSERRIAPPPPTTKRRLECPAACCSRCIAATSRCTASPAKRASPSWPTWRGAAMRASRSISVPAPWCRSNPMD